MKNSPLYLPYFFIPTYFRSILMSITIKNIKIARLKIDHKRSPKFGDISFFLKLIIIYLGQYIFL